MDERRRRMAGLFFVTPFEVYDILEGTQYPQACRDVYETILRYIALREEGWQEPGIWVKGRFRTTKGQLCKLSKISKGHFYRVWDALIAANLIHEDVDGSFLLLKYKKKSDTAYTASQIAAMLERIYELEQQNEKMMEVLEEIRRSILMDEEKGKVLEAMQGGNILTHETDRLTHETDRLMDEAPILLKERKDSLSGNKIISGFYTGIGQEKISKAKRERAKEILKKLKQEFTLEDIAFAVTWTLENAKEQLYDFSIIEHTIGQAMGAKEKEAAREAKRRTEEATREAIREKERVQEEEREQIEAYKENLPEEERTALRETAEREIRESGEFDEDFITDYLINIKENEILRKEIAEKTDEDQEDNV